MKLTYVILMSEGPNNWNGWSPDVPGCASAGKDIDEQRARLKAALKGHIEVCAEFGDPIPWPKSRTIEEGLAADAAFNAEVEAEWPDDPTDEEEGWSPPIAEMIEIEVNIPESLLVSAP